MNAKEIIQQLEEPVEDGLPIKQKIIAEAPIEELINAMREPKTQDTYEILCEILGKRKDPQAVPALVVALYEVSPAIRGEAAQALAQIESSSAGEPLLAQYLAETDQGIKEWEIIALGSVGYRPAIPHLIQALNVENLRRYAAWSLGILKAKEAKDAVQQALDRETSPYAIKMIKQAISELE